MKKNTLLILAALAAVVFFLFQRKGGSASVGGSGSAYAPVGAGGGGGGSGGGGKSSGAASGGGSDASGFKLPQINLGNVLDNLRSIFNRPAMSPELSALSASALAPLRLDTSPLSLSDFTPNPAASFGNYGLGYDSFNTFFGSTPNFSSGNYFQDYASLAYQGSDFGGGSSFSDYYAPTLTAPSGGNFDGGFSFDNSGYGAGGGEDWGFVW